MHDEMPLRPYQDECITATFEGIREGKQRLATVLPTGGGKTVIFSSICRHWTDWGQQGRRLILVHRDELVWQAVEKLRAIAPGLRIGVVKAELDEHAERDVIVGSVQTLKNLARLDRIKASGRIGLVIVDECHHATAASYQLIMRELGCFDGDCIALGYTATLTRNDKTSLGDIWQEVVFQKDILDLIMPDQFGNKYLSNVKGKRVEVNGFSLEDVAITAGDYEPGALGRALLSSDAPDFIADAYLEHSKDKPGIVFTPSVETAQAFSDALNGKGLVSVPVWGAMSRDDRRAALRGAFKGDTQVLVNCMVLTEGFDWPRAETGVIARPTTSPSLYVQMVGRILRLHPDKKEALVLDCVGASQDHRLATIADLTSRRIELVYPDETLMEAVQREQKARNPYLKDYILTWADVDLFQGSKAAWNKTYAGIYFIGTEPSIYFLWPGNEPGLYTVAMCPRKPKAGDKWKKLHENVPLDAAMSWAETEAFGSDSDRLGYSVVNNGASWRRKKQPASESQLNFANILGLKLPAGISKHAASLEIDRKIVSRILDKPLRRY